MTAEAYVKRLHDDFIFFMEEIWKDRSLHKVAPLGWPERDMGHYAAYGPPRRGILAPRGIGKTHIVIAFVLWRLFRDPNRKIIILSKSGGEAKKTVFLIRKWIDAGTGVWFLQHLCPPRGARDNARELDVGGAALGHRQPSVTAIGIDGQLEGNRAHTIIPDDVETHENTKTLTAREDLAHRVHEIESILYPDIKDLVLQPGESPDPELIDTIDPPESVYVGTYHHEESLYLKESKAGVAFRTWPLEYPREGEEHLGLAPKVQIHLAKGTAKPGDIVFGHRFSRTNVDRKKGRGRRYWSMQHQLLCNLADSNRYPLRLSDLIVMNVPPPPGPAPTHVVYGTHDHNGSTAIEDIPCLGFNADRLYRPAMLPPPAEWAKYTVTKAGLDPAGRGDDRTGLAIASHLAGRIYLHRLLGLEGGADEAKLDHIAQLLREFRATSVGLEGNIDTFGTYHLTLQAAIRKHTLRPGDHPDYPNGWGCRIESVRAHGQKETRIIAAVEPVSSTHRLIVDRSVVTHTEGDQDEDDFQFQFSRLTRDPECLSEDGKLDALSILCRMFDNSLTVDPASSSKRIEEARLEAQRREHLALVKSIRTPVSPSIIKHRFTRG